MHNNIIILIIVQFYTRCVSAGNTGVLSGHPAVLNRLQGKIIGSKERAMQFIERDRYVTTPILYSMACICLNCR